MSGWFNNDGVGEAFDRLRKQLVASKQRVDERIIGASREGDYDVAKNSIGQAQALIEIMNEVDALYARFAKLAGQPADSLTAARPSVNVSDDLPPDGRIMLVLKKRHCEARAVYDQGSITVLRGSKLATRERESLSDEARKLRRDLRSLGKLVDGEAGGTASLKVDHRFTSPSAAACFVVGYSANGQREWIVERTGECLGDWRSGKGAK